MQNAQKFDENLFMLAETFRVELSQMQLRAYKLVLSKYTDQQIEEGFLQAIATLKFFPKPAEIIELIEGKPSDQAILAWEKLLQAIQEHGSYYSVIFEDGRIAQTVELMGGWLQICAMTIDETHWRMTDFTKIYQGLPGSIEPKKLIGRHEQENAAHGFIEAIPEPTKIEAIRAMNEPRRLLYDLPTGAKLADQDWTTPGFFKTTSTTGKEGEQT